LRDALPGGAQIGAMRIAQVRVGVAVECFVRRDPTWVVRPDGRRQIERRQGVEWQRVVIGVPRRRRIDVRVVVDGADVGDERGQTGVDCVAIRRRGRLL
jgi:hypothetical protein